MALWKLTGASESLGRCAAAGRGRAGGRVQVSHIRHDVGGEKGGRDFMSDAAAEHMPHSTADVGWVVKLPATCCCCCNISPLLSGREGGREGGTLTCRGELEVNAAM